jgi:hypothetical protein
MTLARRVAAGASAMLLAALSCIDFSTDPDALLYLAFDPLPFPSVVAGDTLRDSTGAVALLSATAVNGRGEEIPGAAVRYYAIGDTAGALQIDSTVGRVVSSDAKPQSVRVVASVGSLQSTPALLAVTTRPDSLALDTANDTISYSFTDTTLNISDLLRVKVLHNDSSTFWSGVGGWVVRFTLEDASDTVFASVFGENNRVNSAAPNGLFHIDTTSADGSGARKLRVRPGPPITTPLDSVGIVVEGKYRGQHLRGSPVRIVVYLRPRT